MQYRSFKETNISEIGLGTWQLGNADWGIIDEEVAFGILNSFVGLGGNFIDTADVYGQGMSEQLIGRFLKDCKKEIYVATKLGRRGDNGNGWPQNFSCDFIRKHIENSLNNLNVNSLFLEQLHCIPKEQLIAGKVFDHLRKMKDEKLIQHWGVSVETSEEALICLEQDGISSIQIIFNLFRQHMADEVFAKAKEKQVAIIARVPLASGLLSGKFDKHTKFAENDHRNFNANGEAFNAGETFSGVEYSKGVELSQELGAHFPDARMASWAIRWILDHPEVSTVIPGASNVNQVVQNMGSSALPPLSVPQHKELRAIYDEKIKPIIRGHY